MPNLFRWRNCRFYFYSHEGNEPPHVHVDCAENSLKVWLHSMKMAYCEGFTSKEAKELMKVIEENRELFLEKWHEHLG